MQLSEVSELRSIIGLMRLNACSSPRFHDRQDSEVDRIYNSSPKVASYEMRSSWMDRPSIQMPPPAPQAPVVASSVQESTVASPKLKPLNGDKRPNAAADKGAAAANGKPKVIVFDKKSKNTKSSGDAGDSDDENAFVFEREPVGSIQSVQTSLLDRALRTGGGGPMMVAGMSKQPVDSPVLKLTIYLPNRQEMIIDLYEVSTVEESIQTILAKHHTEGRQPPLYYGHSECYELRLHESDGYPDEDFPALDRSRKIKNFGDNGDHEYCLCERPDACPPAEGSLPSNNESGIWKPPSTANINQSIGPNARMGDKNFLKIIMPNENYTVIAIKDGMTGKDLLPMLTKKHRLPMLDEYILKASDADKQRLELTTDVIDLDTQLKPLGLQEVTLARKVYADMPAVAAPAAAADVLVDTEDVMANRNVRPPPSTFMYNDVKAAMYKEWKVIKTNKYGKRQHRMLGLDSHKVYNSKVGERAMISRTNIKVAERPISSITWLRFLNGPCDFQIHYSQPDEETIEYSAGSAFECGTLREKYGSVLMTIGFGVAEIVAKIKYIQEMNKRK
ncbi:Aste57867_3962 [Aphanomyces stellatus]|uniref:Aste57867_3962 protein n=1 Tax=Aphanomyces stellatus TaxID=120398 RepID=A0A485KGA5_9STRA|nr:hypothetical protein As57867_003951 [Aphanomyces stellatus]VFT81099.1 Aste57867_3962 [Aphanomyces stellatus]